MSTKSPLELTRRGFVGVAANRSIGIPCAARRCKDGWQRFQGSGEFRKGRNFWPNGARMAISISLMFEGGGQPISGAGGALPEPIKPGFPDQPTNAFFAYGVYEGIPRALDLFDKHDIKVTSFMIGKAVEEQPDLAREIVRRGHEAGAHGSTWTASYDLSPEAEKAFIKQSADTVERITGQKPVGWNAFFMRNSIHISKLCRISVSCTASTNRAEMSPSSSRCAVGTLPWCRIRCT